MATDPTIRRALISVTDKTGVAAFARTLADEFGVEIISTGGTAKALEEAGVKVRPIEDFTGFPEMMDGRVKTLHPKVHGALLARRDSEKHMAEAAAHDIELIDLVVVNLYEFEKTVAKPDVTFADAIEHIDIGGPSMLRSAAKNADSVTVVIDPDDYDAVLAEMRANNGATTLATRRCLQYKVYSATARYDAAISDWMAEQLVAEENLPQDRGLANVVLSGGVLVDPDADGSDTADDAFDELAIDAEEWKAAPDDQMLVVLRKQQDLRYGENPHQAASFYRTPGATEHALVNAEQLNGKPLSYNNLLDTDAAWNLVREFDEPAVVILKHQNPCGSAIADDAVTAYDRAFACDPKSAFGGIIAVNREVDLAFVEHINANKQFVEVLIAPSYAPDALELLQQKKNLRVLATGGIDAPTSLEFRSVDGGMLVQTVDRVAEDPATFTVPTKRKPTDAEMEDLLFAWRVCKGVKSNAILIAKDKMGIGMGPGQPNRVDSALLACQRAHEVCEREGLGTDGLVCASDAFFPFRDNIDTLAAQGVKAIIQPGGSIRDDESIQACDEYGIAMVFTGTRHFRH